MRLYNLPEEAAWGWWWELQLPKGLMGAAMVSAWLAMGLLSHLCASLGTQKQVGYGQVEQILPFLQRSFCSMEKHILKL